MSTILGHPVDRNLAAACEKIGGIRIIGVRCDFLVVAKTRWATAQSGQRVQIVTTAVVGSSPFVAAAIDAHPKMAGLLESFCERR
jgi:hypothetical protein